MVTTRHRAARQHGAGAGAAHVVTAEVSDIGPGVDLVAQRYRHFDRRDLTAAYTMPKLFPEHQMLKAVNDDGRTVGIGEWLRPAYFPTSRVAIRIVAVEGSEGRGVGRAVKDAVFDALPAETTTVSTTVMDDDARSLAIARQWGFTIEGHPIQSQHLLLGATYPLIPADVTVTDCSDLQFPDRQAVEAMIAASDTSPEAAVGMRIDLDLLAAGVGPASTAVGALVRVRGVPAGICFGVIEDNALKIGYTGLHPRFRGQGLGRLVKEVVHAGAAQKGAHRSVTYNDASNTPIRRINDELGYVVHYGYFRVSTTVHPNRPIASRGA